MKMWFHIVFSALILFGSSGVEVYKHICSKEGVSITLFSESDHVCSSEEHDLPACCLKEKEKEKDCCTDEEQIVQLKFSYFQKSQAWLLPISFSGFTIPVVSNYFLSGKVSQTQYAVWDPPPPIRSSRKRAMIQVYTI